MNPANEIKQAYAELDLTPGSSLGEVKEAYRRLARVLHPDLNPGSRGMLMSRINQAYAKLLRHLGSPMDNRSPRPRQSTGAQQAKPYDFQEFQNRPKSGESQAKPGKRPSRRSGNPGNPGNRAARAAREPRQEAKQAAKGPKRPGPRVVRPEHVISEPPDQWRLVGLSQKGGKLIYQVQIKGGPERLELPVRNKRPCGFCRGKGVVTDNGNHDFCPHCGGRGHIISPKIIELELPPSWRPGALIPAGSGIMVELLSMPGEEA